MKAVKFKVDYYKNGAVLFAAAESHPLNEETQMHIDMGLADEVDLPDDNANAQDDAAAKAAAVAAQLKAEQDAAAAAAAKQKAIEEAQTAVDAAQAACDAETDEAKKTELLATLTAAHDALVQLQASA